MSLDWAQGVSAPARVHHHSVELTDWQMLVEKWESGDNFPQFADERRRPPGPPRFTTTLKYVRRVQGQFAYEDHETPWSIARAEHRHQHQQLPRVQRRRDISWRPRQRSRTTCRCGPISRRSFVIDGPTAPPRSHRDEHRRCRQHARRASLDFDQWPEMKYQVKSRVAVPAHARAVLQGRKVAGDRRRATSRAPFICSRAATISPATSRATWPACTITDSRRCTARLHWNRKFFEVTTPVRSSRAATRSSRSASRPSASPPSRLAASTRRTPDVDLAELTDFYRLAGVRFAGRASGRNLLEWPMGRFTRASRRAGMSPSCRPPASRPMGPSLDAGPRGRPEPFAARVGAIPARCRWRRTCRSPAQVTYTFGPDRVRSATASSHPRRPTCRSRGGPPGANESHRSGFT